MLKAKWTYWFTTSSWKWKGFVFFSFYQVGRLNNLELTRVPYNQKHFEVARILQRCSRKLGFLYSFLLPLGAAGLAMSGMGEEWNRGVLIRPWGGRRRGRGEGGGQCAPSQVKPGRLALFSGSEDVVCDFLVWEALIDFICDNIYLIATNDHLW